MYCKVLRVADYTLHYLTLYQYGMSTTNYSSLMSPQASARLGFLQDRRNVSLVIMVIVSNCFPRREATQIHPSTRCPLLTNPAPSSMC